MQIEEECTHRSLCFHVQKLHHINIYYVFICYCHFSSPILQEMTLKLHWWNKQQKYNQFVTCLYSLLLLLTLVYYTTRVNGLFDITSLMRMLVPIIAKRRKQNTQNVSHLIVGDYWLDTCSLKARIYRGSNKNSGHHFISL